MDEELKTYLDTLKSHLDARFAQIDARFEQVDKRFEQVDKRFEQVDANFAQIREELHDTETRLLSEFWKWGRTTEIRVRRLETLARRDNCRPVGGYGRAHFHPRAQSGGQQGLILAQILQIRDCIAA
jgi:hypothetical protein